MSIRWSRTTTRLLFAVLVALTVPLGLGNSDCAPESTPVPQDTIDCGLPDGSVGTTCGGLLGVACPSGLFCDYPIEAACGAADQTGVCRVPPQACTEQYQPVCGCDGKTYDNACAAAGESVSVVHNGSCGCEGQWSCAAPPPGCHYEGWTPCACGTLVCEPGACGGFAGIQCPGGQFCDYPEATQCGEGDHLGTCRTPPGACTEEYQPVCGCDGKTYGNACAARAASVSVIHVGACDCHATPCAAPPEGCEYVGGSRCSCGTLLCQDGGVSP